MANVIQDPADTTMMMMMDNDNDGGGESSSMMMMNLPIEDDGVADNAMMDDDDVDLICPSGCTTITQCEEDRILLEAFLNETDIDLIENPPSAAAAALTASGTSTGRNVRQVSDGTNSQATISTTIPNLPAPPTPEPPPATTIPPPTGRPPIQLYLSCNPDHLSEYQCLIRKNIELFEATEVDVTSRIKGRNKPIVLGQVGIRCIHCKYIHPQQRGRGAMYYPHKLSGIYQAAQILSQGHLMDGGNNNDGGGGKSIICGHVPQSLQQELIRLKAMKSVMTTAGKDYWAGTAQALGVYEDEYGLRFEERLGMVRHPHHPH